MENKFNKHKELFRIIFEENIMKFMDGLLLSIGIQAFDIVKFDDFLHTLGYEEKKYGSMRDYIRKFYGEEGVKLIETLNKI